MSVANKNAELFTQFFQSKGYEVTVGTNKTGKVIQLFVRKADATCSISCFETGTVYAEKPKAGCESLHSELHDAIERWKRQPSTFTKDARQSIDTSCFGPDWQALLDARWKEIEVCIKGEAWLLATVGIGGYLEALLVACGNEDRNAIYSSQKAPSRAAGPKDFREWKLHELIDVACDLKWISAASGHAMSHTLREFRNYIHPHKEFAAAIRSIDEKEVASLKAYAVELTLQLCRVREQIAARGKTASSR